MTGVDISFQDVRAHVMAKAPAHSGSKWYQWNKKVEKPLLRGVSGSIKAGSMVALMGSSGAGKTTLLTALCGRLPISNGTVAYGSGPIPKSDSSTFAFITQDDLFLGNLTVLEHLEIQANLRLSSDMPKEEKKEIVAAIVKRMRLTNCQNNRIGNLAAGEGRGISGGERKRLNIATELLTSPLVVFADEPTTGLDSFLAYETIGLLRELSNEGTTIVCVIHQPSIRILSLFSKLCLMANGRIVYFGDVPAAVDWFGSLGHPCPLYVNPADFYIKLLSVKDEQRIEKNEQLDKWCDEWDARGEAHLLSWGSSKQSAAPTSDLTPEGGKAASAYQRISWFSEVKVLLKRAGIVNVRDPFLVKARIIQTVFLGCVIGGLFFRLGLDIQDSMSKMGAIFVILLNQSLLSGLGVANAFPKEKPIVMMEAQSGVLRSSTYTVAKMTADMPFQVIFPILFNTIVYFMIGFNDDFVSFLLATLVIVLVSLCAVSVGYVTSATASTGDEAIVLFQLIVMPLTLFSGFLVQSSTIGAFWVWMEAISPFKHGLEGYGVAVFKDLPLDPTGPFPSGDEFLDEMFNIGTDKLWFSLTILCVLFIFFRILAVVCLRLTLR